jgi:hypothetical protein
MSPRQSWIGVLGPRPAFADVNEHAGNWETVPIDGRQESHPRLPAPDGTPPLFLSQAYGFNADAGYVSVLELRIGRRLNCLQITLEGGKGYCDQL